MRRSLVPSYLPHQVGGAMAVEAAPDCDWITLEPFVLTNSSLAAMVRSRGLAARTASGAQVRGCRCHHACELGQPKRCPAMDRNRPTMWLPNNQHRAHAGARPSSPLVSCSAAFRNSALSLAGRSVTQAGTFSRTGRTPARCAARAHMTRMPSIPRIPRILRIPRIR
jgi:hypothetical protein